MLDTSSLLVSSQGSNRRWAVLVELSVMGTAAQAVPAVVQDGWRVIEVAWRLGVSSMTSARFLQHPLFRPSDPVPSGLMES